MPTRTPCPSTWTCTTREVVRCALRAGHQHELGAADRLQQQHDGVRRDGVRVTWLPD